MSNNSQSQQPLISAELSAPLNAHLVASAYAGALDLSFKGTAGVLHDILGLPLHLMQRVHILDHLVRKLCARGSRGRLWCAWVRER